MTRHRTSQNFTELLGVDFRPQAKQFIHKFRRLDIFFFNFHPSLGVVQNKITLCIPVVFQLVWERGRIRSWKLRPLSGEDTGTDPEMEAPATFWGNFGSGEASMRKLRSLNYKHT